MNAENKIALALINLTTGGFHLKDGRLYHDDLGELPSVEEIAAVVKENPEKIADMLLDDSVNESLPVELDTPTVRRITAGAGTVFDVERLTRARAEAAERVFDIGKQLMEEAGCTRAVIERAAGLLLRLAKKGYCYKGRTIVNIGDTSEKLPETDFSLIDRTLAAFPCEVAALLAEELTDLPDEIGAAIDTGEASKEDAFTLCWLLAMEATECES